MSDIVEKNYSEAVDSDVYISVIELTSEKLELIDDNNKLKNRLSVVTDMFTNTNKELLRLKFERKFGVDNYGEVKQMESKKAEVEAAAAVRKAMEAAAAGAAIARAKAEAEEAKAEAEEAKAEAEEAKADAAAARADAAAARAEAAAARAEADAAKAEAAAARAEADPSPPPPEPVKAAVSPAPGEVDREPLSPVAAPPSDSSVSGAISPLSLSAMDFFENAGPNKDLIFVLPREDIDDFVTTLKGKTTDFDAIEEYYDENKKEAAAPGRRKIGVMTSIPKCDEFVDLLRSYSYTGSLACSKLFDADSIKYLKKGTSVNFGKECFNCKSLVIEEDGENLAIFQQFLKDHMYVDDRLYIETNSNNLSFILFYVDSDFKEDHGYQLKKYNREQNKKHVFNRIEHVVSGISTGSGEDQENFGKCVVYTPFDKKEHKIDEDGNGYFVSSIGDPNSFYVDTPKDAINKVQELLRDTTEKVGLFYTPSSEFLSSFTGNKRVKKFVLMPVYKPGKSGLRSASQDQSIQNLLKGLYEEIDGKGKVKDMLFGGMHNFAQEAICAMIPFGNVGDEVQISSTAFKVMFDKSLGIIGATIDKNGIIHIPNRSDGLSSLSTCEWYQMACAMSEYLDAKGVVSLLRNRSKYIIPEEERESLHSKILNRINGGENKILVYCMPFQEEQLSIYLNQEFLSSGYAVSRKRTSGDPLKMIYVLSSVDIDDLREIMNANVLIDAGGSCRTIENISADDQNSNKVVLTQARREYDSTSTTIVEASYDDPTEAMSEATKYVLENLLSERVSNVFIIVDIEDTSYYTNIRTFINEHGGSENIGVYRFPGDTSMLEKKKRVRAIKEKIYELAERATDDVCVITNLSEFMNVGTKNYFMVRGEGGFGKLGGISDALTSDTHGTYGTYGKVLEHPIVRKQFTEKEISMLKEKEHHILKKLFSKDDEFFEFFVHNITAFKGYSYLVANNLRISPKKLVVLLENIYNKKIKVDALTTVLKLGGDPKIKTFTVSDFQGLSFCSAKVEKLINDYVISQFLAQSENLVRAFVENGPSMADKIMKLGTGVLTIAAAAGKIVLYASAAGVVAGTYLHLADTTRTIGLVAEPSDSFPAGSGDVRVMDWGNKFPQLPTGLRALKLQADLRALNLQAEGAWHAVGNASIADQEALAKADYARYASVNASIAAQEVLALTLRDLDYASFNANKPCETNVRCRTAAIETGVELKAPDPFLPTYDYCITDQSYRHYIEHILRCSVKDSSGLADQLEQELKENKGNERESCREVLQEKLGEYAESAGQENVHPSYTDHGFSYNSSIAAIGVMTAFGFLSYRQRRNIKLLQDQHDDDVRTLIASMHLNRQRDSILAEESRTVMQTELGDEIANLEKEVGESQILVGRLKEELNKAEHLHESEKAVLSDAVQKLQTNVQEKDIHIQSLKYDMENNESDSAELSVRIKELEVNLRNKITDVEVLLADLKDADTKTSLSIDNTQITSKMNLSDWGLSDSRKMVLIRALKDMQIVASSAIMPDNDKLKQYFIILYSHDIFVQKFEFGNVKGENMASLYVWDTVKSIKNRTDNTTGNTMDDMAVSIQNRINGIDEASAVEAGAKEIRVSASKKLLDAAASASASAGTGETRNVYYELLKACDYSLFKYELPIRDDQDAYVVFVNLIFFIIQDITRKERGKMALGPVDIKIDKVEDADIISMAHLVQFANQNSEFYEGADPGWLDAAFKDAFSMMTQATSSSSSYKPLLQEHKALSEGEREDMRIKTEELNKRAAELLEAELEGILNPAYEPFRPSSRPKSAASSPAPAASDAPSVADNDDGMPSLEEETPPATTRSSPGEAFPARALQDQLLRRTSSGEMVKDPEFFQQESLSREEEEDLERRLQNIDEKNKAYSKTIASASSRYPRGAESTLVDTEVARGNLEFQGGPEETGALSTLLSGGANGKRLFYL